MDKTVFPSFSSEQADHLVRLAKAKLDPDLVRKISNSSLNMNHLVRFMCVGGMCRVRREERGLSFKEISTQLRIPLYRLKEIEENHIQNIVPDILDRYVEVLDLGNEFQKWLEENREVYEGLGERG